MLVGLGKAILCTTRLRHYCGSKVGRMQTALACLLSLFPSKTVCFLCCVVELIHYCPEKDFKDLSMKRIVLRLTHTAHLNIKA